MRKHFFIWRGAGGPGAAIFCQGGISAFFTTTCRHGTCKHGFPYHTWRWLSSAKIGRKITNPGTKNYCNLRINEYNNNCEG